MCEDSEPRCQEWAEGGECEKNAMFMIGDVAAIGRCRHACRACTVCAKDDRACYMENRRQAGYLIYEKEEVDGL